MKDSHFEAMTEKMLDLQSKSVRHRSREQESGERWKLIREIDGVADAEKLNLIQSRWSNIKKSHGIS